MSQTQAGTSVSQISSTTALKQRLATLSPTKLAALQKRLRQQRRSSYEPILARRDGAVHPLCLNQRRLWFIEQLQPGTPLHNVTRAYRLGGPLDVKALRLALQGLVDRHEPLRTTFEMRDGEPAQRVNIPTEVPFSLVDLRQSAQNEEGLELILQERLTAEGRRIFDLSADLMLRTVLYRLADDEHVLQITIHHLACDGWSLRLLFDDLAKMYGGFCSGQTAALNSTATRCV
ncbi:MAG: condensation domain-containing protein, partial [Planctomycetes bacterium]|nr:condensation domain-containing protein [Planctomycetota bacterium]